jgi:glycine betaine/choline ABC-type transport system substrate-binding protein
VRAGVRHFAAGSPGVIAALRSLDGANDDDAMRAMNRAVDHNGAAPEEVARWQLDP